MYVTIFPYDRNTLVSPDKRVRHSFMGALAKHCTFKRSEKEMRNSRRSYRFTAIHIECWSRKLMSPMLRLLLI